MIKNGIFLATFLICTNVYASGSYVEVDDNGQILLTSANKDRVLKSINKGTDRITCDKKKLDPKIEPIEYLSQEENSNFLFLVDEPILVFSGIKKYSLKGTILRLEITKYNELPEYRVPVTILYNNAKYVQKNFWGSEVYSCIDTYYKSADSNFAKSTKTGNSIWRVGKPSESFVIEGFDKKYIIDPSSNNYAREDSIIEIDLKKYIEDSSIAEISKLLVECTSCNLLSDFYQKKFSTFDKSISLTADFRFLKTQLELRKDK